MERGFYKTTFLARWCLFSVKNPKPHQEMICIDVLQSPQTFFRVTRSGHYSIFLSGKCKWFPLETGLGRGRIEAWDVRSFFFNSNKNHYIKMIFFFNSETHSLQWKTNKQTKMHSLNRNIQNKPLETTSGKNQLQLSPKHKTGSEGKKKTKFQPKHQTLLPHYPTGIPCVFPDPSSLNQEYFKPTFNLSTLI